MKILFLIQKSKVNKRGTLPIICRVTINRSRKEFSTGIMVKPSSWSTHLQRVISKEEHSCTVNSRLETIHNKIEKAFLLLKVQDASFDVVDVIRIYKGERPTHEMGVLEVYTKHNNHYLKLVGKDLKPVSWQKFENTKKHLQDFIKWKFNESDVRLKNLKFQFINDFDYFLRTEKAMQQSTINKTLQRFKKLINFAVANDYLDKNPFLTHRGKTVKKPVIFLTQLELIQLQHKQIENSRLSEVKDCFLFCCYTGLAFKEMDNLRRSHLVKDKMGKVWIRMIRQKTGKPVSVPLLPIAQEIIDKYEGRIKGDKVLPSKTNAHFNAYLKEIGDICGIETKLTHHVARRTFATTVLLYNDVPMEIVSKLLGHSRMGITQAYYGQIVECKVGEHMETLSKKLPNNV